MAGTLISGSDTVGFHTIGDTSKQYTGKNHRRTWWNSYQNRWDGLIPQSGGFEDSDHYIVTDIDGTPVFTTLQLERRNSGRPTVYWDHAAKKLHVFGSHNTTCMFWTMDYDDVTDAYSFSVGADGVGITVTQANRIENGKTFAMTKTPNGDIWVFGTSTNSIKVQRSTDDGATWKPSETNITSVNDAGSVDCGWFERGGINYACVFVSEDDLTPGAEQYFYYIDEDNSSVNNPNNWTNDSASIPSIDVGARADDHVCMCRDSNHKLFIVYKTGNPGEDDIKLVTRTAAGVWAGPFEVWSDAEGKTRPNVAIKHIDGTTDEELIVIASVTGSGSTIVYKTSPVDTISFSADTVLFEDTVGSDTFNDSTVASGDFIYTAETGVLVLAENMTDEVMWYNKLSITAAASGGSFVPRNQYNCPTMNALLVR